MILDPAHNNATELSWVQTYATASGAVLGFNEPYNSAISVADAVSLTGTLNAMFPPSSGVLIVSPSGDVGAASPKAWFDDYFNQCAAAGYRVDIFAFHWSGGWSAGGFNANSSFTNMALNLDAVITRYGLDVWCTEMELYTLDDSGPSLTDYKALWALMIPYLQNYRKVRRYAFWPVGPNPFTGNIAPFSLANFDGSLTAAGSAYSLFGR